MIFKSKIEKRLEDMIEFCESHKQNKTLFGVLGVLHYIKTGDTETSLKELDTAWNDIERQNLREEKQ